MYGSSRNPLAVVAQRASLCGSGSFISQAAWPTPVKTSLRKVTHYPLELCGHFVARISRLRLPATHRSADSSLLHRRTRILPSSASPPHWISKRFLSSSHHTVSTPSSLGDRQSSKKTADGDSSTHLHGTGVVRVKRSTQSNAAVGGGQVYTPLLFQKDPHSHYLPPKPLASAVRKKETAPPASSPPLVSGDTAIPAKGAEETNEKNNPVSCDSSPVSTEVVSADASIRFSLPSSVDALTEWSAHECPVIQVKCPRQSVSSSTPAVVLEDPLAWLQQEGDHPAACEGPCVPVSLEAQLEALRSYYLEDRGRESCDDASSSLHHGSERRVTRRSSRAPCHPPAKLSGEAEPKVKQESEKFLLFNVFTRRVAQSDTASVQALRYLGIRVCHESRLLVLDDPEALHTFTVALHDKSIQWPTHWSSTVFRRFRRLLESSTLQNVSERVREFLHLYQHKVSGLADSVTCVETASSPPDPQLVAIPHGGSHVSEAVEHPHDTTARERLLSVEDLSEEQRRVLDLALEGHHLYVGGSAGTGKSVLLRVLRRRLVEEGLAVAVTATTGLAAFHIGGTTLHHRFGITLEGRILRRKELRSYDVIVIDEVSMLSQELFEELELQLRLAHRNELPFGGVQMILCGDFLQLGAIGAKSIVVSSVFRQHFIMLKLMKSIRQESSPLFYIHLQALRQGQVLPSWDKTVRFIDTLQHFIETTTSERGDVAEGSLREEETPNGREPPLPPGVIPLPPIDDTSPGIPAVIVENAVNLLPTNGLARQANRIMLSKLDGEEVEYHAMVTLPQLQDRWTSSFLLLDSSTRTSAEACRRSLTDLTRLQASLLDLAVSCFLQASPPPEGSPSDAAEEIEDLRRHPERHVVLYRLYSDGLVFRVRVPSCVSEQNMTEVDLKIREQISSFLHQHPSDLRLSQVLPSASGLHTEQDEAVLQQYVMRSQMAPPFVCKLGARVMLRTNLSATLVNGSLGTVVGFVEMKPTNLLAYQLRTCKQRAESVEQYADFLCYEHNFTTPPMPLVDFGDGNPVAVPPVHFPVGGFANTHFYISGVLTIPLSLAYAFTVHKVQGLTLVGRVHLELSRMWPCEHLLYVAMSRVKNPDQLSISNFHIDLVRVAADCLLFDKSVPAVAEAKVLPHFIPAAWVRESGKRKRAWQRKRRHTQPLKARRVVGSRGSSRHQRRQIEAIQALFLAKSSKMSSQALLPPRK